MPVYYFLDGTGAQCFIEADRKPAYALACTRRFPESFERWDPEAKAFVIDEAAQLASRVTPLHIALMHERKAREAREIKNDRADPDMLLVREAEIRNITPDELADIVIAKAAEAEELELERQRASLSEG